MTLEHGEAKQGIERGPESIRISVANIIRRVRVKETGATYYPAILNPGAFAKGERKYQALGGGVKMTPLGTDNLKSMGAEFGPKESEEHDDARFVISADKFQEAFDAFAKLSPDSFESDPIREIREELSQEKLSGTGSILTEDETKEIEAEYMGAVCQLPNLPETSERTAAVPSRRLFHLFEIVVPKRIFEKMQKSTAMKLFSEKELKDIAENHAQEGKQLWKMEDAQGVATIADNIFPPDFVTE